MNGMAKAYSDGRFRFEIALFAKQALIRQLGIHIGQHALFLYHDSNIRRGGSIGTAISIEDNRPAFRHPCCNILRLRLPNDSWQYNSIPPRPVRSFRDACVFRNRYRYIPFSVHTSVMIESDFLNADELQGIIPRS